MLPNFRTNFEDIYLIFQTEISQSRLLCIPGNRDSGRSWEGIGIQSNGLKDQVDLIFDDKDDSLWSPSHLQHVPIDSSEHVHRGGVDEERSLRTLSRNPIHSFVFSVLTSLSPKWTRRPHSG